MVTVTSNTAITLTALKVGGIAVNAANYTFVNNVLTILDDYLATLANGEKTFTIVMSAGDGDVVEKTVTVTVGD